MIEVWGLPVVASVEDVVRSLRTELHAAGVTLLRDAKLTHGNVMLTCPVHGDGKEKKPSCGISTVEVTRNGRVYPAGTVNCFRCAYTSDLATFISTCYGITDGGMFGYKWIAERFVSVEIERRPDIKLDMSRDVLPAVEVTYVGEDRLDDYRLTHPYMYERKLTDEVIDYFDVGYDAEANALTFPVRDLSGKVVFVQRRAVFGKSFLNAEDMMKSTVVYGLYEVYRNLSWITELYITESIIDALTLWTVRKPAVALLGAIPSIDQIKLLKRLPVRKFISGLDNDEAGKLGTERLRKTLGKVKIIYRINFPDGVKDVNELSNECIANLESVLV